MNRIEFCLVILLIPISLLSCSNATITKEGAKSQQLFAVKRIVDGDTFYADDGSSKGLKIRLIGIDAPESRKTGKKEVGYFGKEAKEYLSRLLTGKNVRLDYDFDKFDRYGRTLAYVYLEDSTFVNAELLKQGFAMVMTIPPNIKYAEQFVKLQQEARENNRGLWAETSR